MRAKALHIWGEALATLGAPVEALELDHGRVWGLDIVVDAWLVGPVPRDKLDGDA